MEKEVAGYSEYLPKLIISDSDNSADMLYSTRFQAPDDFIFIQDRISDDKLDTSIILNKLEISRARKIVKKIDNIILDEELEPKAQERFKLGKKKPSLLQIAAERILSRDIKHVAVPRRFPYAYAVELNKYGIELSYPPCHLFPERKIKTQYEIRQIRRALEITQEGLKRATEILEAAKTRPSKKLEWNGSILTSEILRGEIDSAVLKSGGIPRGTIVACGKQACDPHEVGYGPLFAGELIIIDIFPRDVKSGYFGDLTRTFIKGKANDAQYKLWQTVLDGQILAIKSIHAKIKGEVIYQKVCKLFKSNGYKTEVINNNPVGFFHGLGHAIGLDLHEEPRFNTTELKHGMVFTVEPGLYYPEIGGVRHEDVVVVKEDGCEVLSDFPKVLEV